MARDRRPAGAIENAEKCPFADQRGCRCMIVDRRQERLDLRVAKPAFDADRALTDSGQEVGRRQQRPDLGGKPEPPLKKAEGEAPASH